MTKSSPTQSQIERKAARIVAHIRRCPWDGSARTALRRLPASVGDKFQLPPLAKSPVTLRSERGETLSVGKAAAECRRFNKQHPTGRTVFVRDDAGNLAPKIVFVAASMDGRRAFVGVGNERVPLSRISGWKVGRSAASTPA